MMQEDRCVGSQTVSANVTAYVRLMAYSSYHVTSINILRRAKIVSLHILWRRFESLTSPSTFQQNELTSMHEFSAESAFCSVADSCASCISVFECKCAIVRSLGVNIPVRELSSILKRRCGWEQNGEGINFEQFRTLFTDVKHCMDESTSNIDHYAHFDTKNKGWINERDVYLVNIHFLSSCQTCRLLYTHIS